MYVVLCVPVLCFSFSSQLFDFNERVELVVLNCLFTILILK